LNNEELPCPAVIISTFLKMPCRSWNREQVGAAELVKFPPIENTLRHEVTAMISHVQGFALVSSEG
jgi:hypothetical protein